MFDKGTNDLNNVSTKVRQPIIDLAERLKVQCCFMNTVSIPNTKYKLCFIGIGHLMIIDSKYTKSRVGLCVL